MQTLTRILRLCSSAKARVSLVALSAFVALMAVPALAGATETPTAEKVKVVAEKVGSEGVEIVLIILAALTALLVAVIVIPKASREEHVRENRAAHDIVLSPEELTELDAASPPPRRATPLEMI